MANTTVDVDQTMEVAQLLVDANAHMKNVTMLIQQDLDPKVRGIVMQPVVDLLISELKLLQSKISING